MYDHYYIELVVIILFITLCLTLYNTLLIDYSFTVMIFITESLKLM